VFGSHWVGGGCSADIPCPSAVNGKVTLCGRLYDLETNQKLEAAAPTAQQCGSGGASDGPCELGVEVYDAINFAQNPGGAAPLNHMAVYIDDCGRYKIEGITPPSSTFMGIGVDDASGGADNHKLTGVALPAAANQTINGFTTYSETNATDTSWSTQASQNPGFAAEGVYVGIFLHAGAPVAGVTLKASGSTDPTNDFYFNDASNDTRTTLDGTLDATGQNGTGLMINIAGLAQMTGTGAETSGCIWPTDQGASIPGVVFVQQRVEKMGSVDCP
jgi:hypothetical protein